MYVCVFYTADDPAWHTMESRKMTMLAVCTYARRKEEDQQEQCESAGVEYSSDEVVESSEEEGQWGTSTQEEGLREELEGEQELQGEQELKGKQELKGRVGGRERVKGRAGVKGKAGVTGGAGVKGRAGISGELEREQELKGSRS